MKRNGTLLLATIFSLSLSACVSVAPTETPAVEAELPESWTAAPEEAEPAAQLQARWWSEFGDPELDTVIEEVLVANNDLAAAAARVDAAVARARIAGADLYPQIGVGLDGSRSRRNFIGFPIPGGESGVLSTTTTSVGASLNVSWEADLWGRLRAGRSSAQASVEAAAADLASARLSLAGQAAKAWFAAAEARLQLELAEETFASRSLTSQRIRRRYELGTRGALDLRQALTNESNAEATLATRERQLDAAERQLELLLSRYPGRSAVSDSAEALPEPPTGLPPLLPSELVTRRPDLAAVESRLTAAGFDIKEARASLYPRLALTGSTGRVSEDIEDLLDSDFSVWSLAANLLQPVFQGGRLRAGVDLTEARYRELAESYAQSVLRAFAEVELALTAEETLAREVEALERSVEQSVAAQRLAENRYGAGLADFLTVLQAQRDATLTQVALLAVQRQRLDARIDLYLALGGGFDSAGEVTASTTNTTAPLDSDESSSK
jgi:NodT family efflux transporter outer membrane factor (OMF) lipoprotein